MTDSFADLWTSSVPSKPTTPQTLGNASAPLQRKNIGSRPTQPDVFAMLSSASSTPSSNPNSRPITPSHPSLAQPKPSTRLPKPSSGDAFSDLLSGSLGGSANNSANLTIAERARLADRQRHEALQTQHKPSNQPSAWDGLDKLASSSPSVADVLNDQWNPSTAHNATAATIKVTNVSEDDWGLDDFKSSTSNPTKAESSSSSSALLWDLDDFAAPAPSSSSSHLAPSSISSSTRTPSPLSRTDVITPDHDKLLSGDEWLSNGDHDGGDDDILGDLSKPIDSLPKKVFSSTNDGTTDTRQPRIPSRSNSPPPHILGQIVEMGFSIQQARAALASTETGLDVQAAVEALVSGAGATATPPPSHPQQQNRDRERLSQIRDVPRGAPSPTDIAQQKERNIQEQADKLIAQASEIGLSMFNKASYLWKEGREKVQKVYEERAASSSSGVRTSSRPSDARMGGRPKWMQDVIADEADDIRDKKLTETFSDGQPQEMRRKITLAERKAPVAETLLGEDDPPKVYSSPYRRAKPKPKSQPLTPVQPPQTHSQSSLTVSPPARPSSPPIVRASPSIISQSHAHKTRGTELFKLGQFPGAEEAYTAAITVLPAGHRLLVPLFNNRSLVRMKTGDYTGAGADATEVVALIGAEYRPRPHSSSKGEVKEEEGQGESVDLGDGLMKALKRTAEAYEGREKWKDAGAVWEALAGRDWIRPAVRSEAVRGAGRCRRMVDSPVGGDGVRDVLPKPKPKPKRTPENKTPMPPSVALQNLQAANSVALAEDQERHELKDHVDAKVLAWKKGKESNVRALMGSLDMVLWPELGMPKVGLSELVTPAQVKGRYMRAIARVHPDKLNASNSTVEQRMLANAVFGSLNEAWNAFKQ